MKRLIIFGIAALLMSCSTKRHVTKASHQEESSLIKSELYFNNCDSVLGFLKTVIINNNSDKNLKIGHFRIPFINSSYEYTKFLFPEQCFIGMSDAELKKMFGQGIDAGDFATYYILQNINHRLAIEVWIREGLVAKFKVGPSTVEKTLRTNEKR